MTHDSTDSNEALLKQVFLLPKSSNAEQKLDEKLTQAVMKRIHREIWLRNILSIASLALVTLFILLQLSPWLEPLPQAMSWTPYLLLSEPNVTLSPTYFYPLIVLLLGLFIPYLFERLE